MFPTNPRETQFSCVSCKLRLCSVGWKASNSMGMKGRQSVWSGKDTQEEANSREHVFSSRKTSQERSQVLERSSLRS